MAELRTLARPYAKAAFQSANEASTLSVWSEQLNSLGAIASDTKVAGIIGSPTAEAKEQVNALEGLLGGDVDRQINNFLNILAENKRLSLLPAIAELFSELKSVQEKTVDVSISTAFSLDQATEEKLVSALKEKLQRDVNVDTFVDKSLLGGVLVRAGDIVIDGSVRGRLSKLAEAMSV